MTHVFCVLYMWPSQTGYSGRGEQRRFWWLYTSLMENQKILVSRLV